MPNKCTKCGFIFCDDINIINGCHFCNGKSFFYSKNIDDSKIKNENNKLFIQKIQLDHIQTTKQNTKQKPIESVKILNHGSYELNLDYIFKNKDMIVELKEEGKYAIDLSSILKKKIKK